MKAKKFHEVFPHIDPDTLAKLADQGSCFPFGTIDFSNPFEEKSGFADWSKDMTLRYQEHERKQAEAAKLNEGYTTGKHAISLDINLGGNAAKALRDMNQLFEDFARRMGFAAQHSNIASTFQLLSRPPHGIEQYRNKILACADDRFTQVDKRLCP